MQACYVIPKLHEKYATLPRIIWQWMTSLLLLLCTVLGAISEWILPKMKLTKFASHSGAYKKYIFIEFIG